MKKEPIAPNADVVVAMDYEEWKKTMRREYGLTSRQVDAIIKKELGCKK